MTKLVLLGGNNIHNQDWIKVIEISFKSFFDTTYIHTYQHWLLGEGNMNIEKEIGLLYDKIKGDEDIVIFAKSLGTLLAMKIIVEKGISPKKCIFVGLPLKYIYIQGFPLKEYISQISCPILFIQHTDDRAGSYKELIEEISDVKNFSFKEIPGDDHEYDEVNDIKNIIEKYI